MSCSATNDQGWSAVAKPELDLIQVKAGDRLHDLICHWPHRLAWIGGSLIVSTMDRDVLLFHDIAESVRGAARPSSAASTAAGPS